MSHGPDNDTQCNGAIAHVMRVWCVYDAAEVLSESEESLHQEGNKEELAENRSLGLRVIRRGVDYVYLHINFKYSENEVFKCRKWHTENKART